MDSAGHNMARGLCARHAGIARYVVAHTRTYETRNDVPRPCFCLLLLQNKKWNRALQTVKQRVEMAYLILDFLKVQQLQLWNQVNHVQAIALCHVDRVSYQAAGRRARTRVSACVCVCARAWACVCARVCVCSCSWHGV